MTLQCNLFCEMLGVLIGVNSPFEKSYLMNKLHVLIAQNIRTKFSIKLLQFSHSNETQVIQFRIK